MKFSLIQFFRSQFTTLPEVDIPDLSGRNVIVTGSNVGLGYECAKAISRANPARLILAVRNTQAGESAAREIVSANPSTVKTIPEVWKLDLGDLSSVKAFADRAEKELDRLDIVVSNAGISTDVFKLTVDDFESTYQVNNIANSLLSVLLLPLLRKTADNPIPGKSNLKPHLAIVASEMHHHVSEKVPGYKEDASEVHKHFTEKDRFRPVAQYNVSKAINVLNVRTLSQLAGDKIVVNSINPGFCYSELTRNAAGVVGIVIGLMKMLLARTTEVGARNLTWAATQEMPTGSYVEDCHVSEPSDLILSQEGQVAGQKIWEEMKNIWSSRLGVDADDLLA